MDWPSAHKSCSKPPTDYCATKHYPTICWPPYQGGRPLKSIHGEIKAMKKKEKSNNQAPVQPLPLLEEISKLAQSYWEDVGRPEGAELRHWLRAEEVFRAKGFRPHGEPQ